MSKQEINAEQARMAKIYLQSTKALFVDKKLLSDQKILKINGIDVYFPYKPYDLQIKFMKRVI